MNQVFARPGESLQQIGGSCPDDWVTMESVRPEGDFLADATGKWIAAPPAVPLVVSRFQGREAMWQTPHGVTTLFEAAEAVLADPETPPMYKRAWDDLQEFHFDSEMLIAIATALGLTEQDRKNLFILAGSIKA